MARLITTQTNEQPKKNIEKETTQNMSGKCNIQYMSACSRSSTHTRTGLITNSHFGTVTELFFLSSIRTMITRKQKKKEKCCISFLLLLLVIYLVFKYFNRAERKKKKKINGPLRQQLSSSSFPSVQREREMMHHPLTAITLSCLFVCVENSLVEYKNFIRFYLYPIRGKTMS